MGITNGRGAHAQPRSDGSRRASYLLATGVILGSASLLAPASALAVDTSTLNGTGIITMIHAVPGLVADVSVDGKQILTGFTASRVTDPVTLSAGTHTVTLKADNGPDAGKTVLTAKLNITAGTTSTAVVGLTPDGSPKAFVFPEMPLPVPTGQAGVVVRQVAASAPVKLVIDGSATSIGPLANGASTTTNATPGTHQVVVKSTTGTTELGAEPATLEANRVTTLYLTGSQKDATLAWVATTRLASATTSLSAIPTGDGSTGHAVMTIRNNVPIGTAAAIAIAVGGAAGLISRKRNRLRARA